MKKEIQYHSLFCKYSSFKIFMEYDKRKLKKYLKRRYKQSKNIKINDVYIEEGTIYMIEMEDLVLEVVSDHEFIYLELYFSFHKLNDNYVYNSTLRYSDIPKNILKITLEELVI